MKKSTSLGVSVNRWPGNFNRRLISISVFVEAPCRFLGYRSLCRVVLQGLGLNSLLRTGVPPVIMEK
jgi:hypothetical protein